MTCFFFFSSPSLHSCHIFHWAPPRLPQPPPLLLPVAQFPILFSSLKQANGKTPNLIFIFFFLSKLSTQKLCGHYRLFRHGERGAARGRLLPNVRRPAVPRADRPFAKLTRPRGGLCSSAAGWSHWLYL